MEHWERIPGYLKVAYIRTRVRELPVDQQPEAHLQAAAQLATWAKAFTITAGEIAGERESTATPDLDETTFSAGWTDGGLLLLLWPKAGEFIQLGPTEIAVLRRILGS